MVVRLTLPLNHRVMSNRSLDGLLSPRRMVCRGMTESWSINGHLPFFVRWTLVQERSESLNEEAKSYFDRRVWVQPF